ncbi:MAG: hypothetical protein BGO43_13695 [Gammaproteobacteria bacterium 39-13]|nr:C4-dicarboxylic acid transporter DauA [Gammaproteobacteria bacterium]OJV88930.1 MAG: hypothetical protein BGO43_13695 [Gammaproteobacteria bacterium 39-13]
MTHSTEKFPLSWALRQTFQQGYNLKTLKADLGAGLVVSLIALPLSMALAIAIGMPPQQGIYTAIVAGIAAAIFGGSHYQISGPTAAFVVILIPIVAEFGLRGLIWCQILAGLMLILFSIIKLGKFIHYIPHPVIIGFTTGIALVLATISLKDFLGLQIADLGPHFIDKISHLYFHLAEISLPETCIGITTIILILSSKRFIKAVPSPMIGVLGGSLLGWGLSCYGYSISTIGTQFSFLSADGSISYGIPAVSPHFQLPTFTTGNLFSIPSLAEIKTFLGPAFIIACLAALESLLSASIADNLTQSKHHPNAELSGIGIANVLSALASGIPATAAIARTATNIQSGAKSPFAAVFHSLFILLYVLLLAPFICHVPMTVLAALLLLTAYNMSHLPQFIELFKTAPLFERIVLFSSFALTVFMDMIAGVMVGIALSTLFYLIRNNSFIMRRFD